MIVLVIKLWLVGVLHTTPKFICKCNYSLYLGGAVT